MAIIDRVEVAVKMGNLGIDLLSDYLSDTDPNSIEGFAIDDAALEIIERLSGLAKLVRMRIANRNSSVPPERARDTIAKIVAEE